MSEHVISRGALLKGVGVATLSAGMGGALRVGEVIADEEQLPLIYSSGVY